MKVILTRDVPKVGRDGEVVSVADGYARNYLFPRQLAVVAKGAAMKQHDSRIAHEAAKTATLRTAAETNGEKLRDKEFQILANASAKSTRLFGSVTEADVAEVIKASLGVEIDKRKISLIDPIKVTGRYELTAKLHPDVVVPFSVDVVTREQLEQREKDRLHEAKLAAAEAARNAPVPVAPAPEPDAEANDAETVEETETTS